MLLVAQRAQRLYEAELVRLIGTHHGVLFAIF